MWNSAPQWIIIWGTTACSLLVIITAQYSYPNQNPHHHQQQPHAQQQQFQQHAAHQYQQQYNQQQQQQQMPPPEQFSSMAELENLPEAVHEIIKIITTYIDADYRRLMVLKETAVKFAQLTDQILPKATRQYNATVPTNLFKLLKIVSLGWLEVMTAMRQNPSEAILHNFTAEVPTLTDLSGSVNGLFRVQDVYNISVHDIASGKIPGVTDAAQLTAHDCFVAGNIAYNFADYYHTITWMQEAWDRVATETPPTVAPADILDRLSVAMEKQGNLQRALELTQKLLQLGTVGAASQINLYFATVEQGARGRALVLVPQYQPALNNLQYLKTAMAKEGIRESLVMPPLVNPPRPCDMFECAAYEALCRGDLVDKPKQRPDAKQPFCYYKRNAAYLKLAPFKVEILNLRPRILLFKNVISDSEAAVFKELAKPKLSRAGTVDRDIGNGILMPDRVSKNAWLDLSGNAEMFAIINKRAELITDMTTKTTETYQVVNYGFGGHYVPHYDFIKPDDHLTLLNMPNGNRIATLLYYLSEPIAGGSTVFPILKLAVRPSKNDALFWYNLYRSGERDYRTLHGACPVLAGQKWVSNSWFHERGQEFNRKCAPEKKV